MLQENTSKVEMKIRKETSARHFYVVCVVKFVRKLLEHVFILRLYFSLFQS